MATHFGLRPGKARMSLYRPVRSNNVERLPKLLTRFSVYTLWKEPNLLPFLTTPEAVVPKLVGGADLMIPGGQPSHSIFVASYLRPNSYIQASRPAFY